ncbi:unnamed protein product [Ranitomeya imitator]|uniref:Nuclear-interacting partner of ALK n=1 Tax=Ranitomeya imitator TaxID=111125 RepID=A0ABN9MP19_9NEOB|nr:unnamed protein product [Ranitomeya imitator]
MAAESTQHGAQAEAGAQAGGRRSQGGSHWPPMDSFTKVKNNLDMLGVYELVLTWRIIMAVEIMNLKKLPDPRDRQILSRYRLSAHSLAIKCGRHRQSYKPREERLCQHCDQEAIEDETHFLLHCSKYSAVRDTLQETLTSLPRLHHHEGGRENIYPAGRRRESSGDSSASARNPEAPLLGSRLPVRMHTSGAIKMAAPSSESSGTPLKSPVGTPGKVRDLINEGIATEEWSGDSRKDTSVLSEENNSFQVLDDSISCEAASKEAFFSRYGWSSIECDMLKCSSCSAYLCASLQPGLDFNTYKQRCSELQEALRTSHEKYCFWPDSPCPEHFRTLLVSEPSSVISDFIERLQNLCHLELQLPALKPDNLKSMDITEETVSLLLRLVEDELQERENTTHCLVSESLQVHISACILALCGWNSRLFASLHHSLSSVYEEGWLVELPTAGCLQEKFFGERTPLGVMSPNRRFTRSRDLEQSPSLVNTQVRSGGSSVSPESDNVRSRPVTRSMGHGEYAGVASEIYSSPHRKAKRPRLSSTGSTDLSPKACFDPLNQHRSWCPWLTVGQGGDQGKLEAKENGNSDHTAVAGWKEVLRVLLGEEKNRTRKEADSSVFLIGKRASTYFCYLLIGPNSPELLHQDVNGFKMSHTKFCCTSRLLENVATFGFLTTFTSSCNKQNHNCKATCGTANCRQFSRIFGLPDPAECSLKISPVRLLVTDYCQIKMMLNEKLGKH